jgi:hypothetical protein
MCRSGPWRPPGRACPLPGGPRRCPDGRIPADRRSPSAAQASPRPYPVGGGSPAAADRAAERLGAGEAGGLAGRRGRPPGAAACVADRPRGGRLPPVASPSRGTASAPGGLLHAGAWLPRRDRLWVYSVALSQLRSPCLTLVERATPGRGRAGAPLESLSHQASRAGLSWDWTPAHPGTKHIANQYRNAGRRERFYSSLYLGLYYEAERDRDRARRYISLAADMQALEDYMGWVAIVHRRLRGWAP